MTKILISNKIVDDALNYGYKYVENNQFKKGVKYLEFALTTVKKDQYLLYALIVSYYNMGNITRVKRLLKEIEEVKVDNLIIEEAVEQIKEDLKSKALLKSNKIIPEKILDDVENLKILQSKLRLNPDELRWIAKHSNDPVYTFLSMPNFESDNYKLFEKQYSYFLNSLIKYEKFKDYYLREEEYNELKLYSYYNSSLKAVSHSAFIIRLSKEEILSEIMKDKKVSKYLKNELMYDFKLFLKKGYLQIEDLDNFVKNIVGKINLKDFKEKVALIEKSIEKTPLYKEPKLFNYAMSIIVKFLRTHVDEFNKFKNEEIEKKIFEYFYFSNISISDELAEFISENYKIDKNSYNATIKELNKISLIL